MRYTGYTYSYGAGMISLLSIGKLYKDRKVDEERAFGPDFASMLANRRRDGEHMARIVAQLVRDNRYGWLDLKGEW